MIIYTVASGERNNPILVSTPAPPLVSVADADQQRRKIDRND